MSDLQLPAQVVRCPECGKMYPAEEEQCPHCTPAAELRRALRRRQADPNSTRLKRLVWILAGTGTLLIGAMLTYAYFKLGRQGMIESLSIPLIAAGVMYPWLFLLSIIERLADVKGRSSFWVILGILIPISPLITIPVLILLPSKTGAPVTWKDILGRALFLPAALAVVVFIVLYTAFVVFQTQ